MIFPIVSLLITHTHTNTQYARTGNSVYIQQRLLGSGNILIILIYQICVGKGKKCTIHREMLIGRYLKREVKGQISRRHGEMPMHMKRYSFRQVHTPSKMWTFTNYPQRDFHQGCQQKKLVRRKIKQPMVLTDTPNVAFDKISMDIMGPLLISLEEYILTVQDLLTKYSVTIPN